MSKSEIFPCGALVFAKVKGYPAWPARITSNLVAKTGKYKVFFFGTYETADVLRSRVWLFTQETKEKMATGKVLRRKNFMTGLYQLENHPDIACPLIESPYSDDQSQEEEDEVKERDIDAAEDVREVKQKVSKKVKWLIKEPNSEKLSKIKQPLAHTVIAVGDNNNNNNNNVSEVGYKSFKEFEAEEESICKESLQTEHINEELSDGDSFDEREWKVWVRLKSRWGNGNLVEVEMKKPKRWKTNKQKQRWKVATAKNAQLFKNMVEKGNFVPSEVLQGGSEGMPEELSRRSEGLKGRKRRLTWLKTEHRLAELNRDVRAALNSDSPQMASCLKALADLEQLSGGVRPLMLVKQADLVDTLRKVKVYRGPAELENYTEQERGEIDRMVREIGEVASRLLERFIRLFRGFDPEGRKSFPDFFHDIVKEFEDKTNDLDDDKVLCLTEDSMEFDLHM